MSIFKIAIFGRYGFLGSHFFNYFANDPLYEVLGVGHTDSSLAKLWDFEPNYIFHCALVNNGHDNGLFEQYQLDGLALQTSKDLGAQLITFGTDASYPELTKPHQEEFYMTGEPYKQWTHYAYQKRALVNVLQARTIPMWYHFVLTSMFGPGFNVTDNHLMHDIIRKVCDYKHFHSNCGKMIKFGRPDFCREVVYVDDVVENVANCVFGKQFGLHEVTNCGSQSKSLPIYDLVHTVCEVLEFDFDRCEFDRSASGTSVKYLDNSKIVKGLGELYADMPLKEAIINTADYYIGKKL
jgi:nucleoside-diphosphate-sugar epimerase